MMQRNSRVNEVRVTVGTYEGGGGGTVGLRLAGQDFCLAKGIECSST